MLGPSQEKYDKNKCVYDQKIFKKWAKNNISTQLTDQTAQMLTKIGTLNTNGILYLNNAVS